MPTGAQHEALLSHIRRVVHVPDYDGMTDGQLLEHFLANQDETSFEAILRRHGPMVLGACQRMLKNDADSEDAFQATFLVLVRKARSIVPREKVGNWLYGVACNTARRARDANVRRYRNERQVEQMPQMAAPSQEASDWAEVLDCELEKLPEKYRLPIVLCDLECRARSEVAEQLGIPQGTLSSRLARGRKRLARRLAGRGLSVSTAALPALLTSESLRAAVPSTLMMTTVRTATSLVAGASDALNASNPAIALMEGVMKTMSVEKLKRTVLVAATFLLGSLVLGVVLQTADAGRGEHDKKPDQKPAEQAVSPSRQPGQKTKWKLWKQFKTSESIPDLAWSPDGTILAGVEPINPAGKSSIRMWNIKTGKVETLGDAVVNSDNFLQVRFSPDGKTIGATANGVRNNDRVGLVFLWDARSKKQLAVIKEPWRKIALAFSPDGAIVAVTSAKAILTFRDSGTGKQLQRGLMANEKLGRFVAYSPNGKLIAVGGTASAKQSSIYLQRANSNIGICGLKGVTKATAVRFSRDGNTIFASGTGGVCLWDVGNVEKGGYRMYAPQKFIARGERMVACMDLSPDGKTLVIGKTVPNNSENLLLYDVATGKRIAVLPDNSDGVNAVAFSPDGTRLATSGKDRTVKIWTLNLVAPGRGIAPNHLQKAQGAWHVVRHWSNGTGFGNRDGAGNPLGPQVVVSGRKIKIQMRPNDPRGETYEFLTKRVDATKQPKQIDIAPINIGNQVIRKGIYELGNDTIRCEFALPGQPRPKRFEEVQGVNNITNLLILRRVK